MSTWEVQAFFDYGSYQNIKTCARPFWRRIHRFCTAKHAEKQKSEMKHQTHPFPSRAVHPLIDPLIHESIQTSDESPPPLLSPTRLASRVWSVAVAVTVTVTGTATAVGGKDFST